MHWFYDPTFTKDSTRIRSDEIQHFKSLRIRVGEEVVVTDGSGNSHHCEAIDPAKGEVRVENSRQHDRPEVKIQLIQAIAKGDRDEMALQASVELGCSSVVAWQAEHSISRWDGKEQKSLERWRQIAVAAMKQSQQAFLPDVQGPLSTSQLKPIGHGILLLPEAELPLSEVDLGATEYSLVVGPEGGIAKPEIEQLTASGFVAYRLGESVMRTSTAGPAAIATIKTLRGLW